jgi:hypothetical protein
VKELTFERNDIQMTTIDTTALEPQIHVTEFELEGFHCIRYFHPATGALGVDGPKGSRPARKRYIRKYEGLCRNQALRESLSNIRPETPMNVKLHAFLHLMEEHKDEATRGVMITPELFITVLDSFAPWTPVGPEAQH